MSCYKWLSDSQSADPNLDLDQAGPNLELIYIFNAKQRFYNKENQLSL